MEDYNYLFYRQYASYGKLLNANYRHNANEIEHSIYYARNRLRSYFTGRLKYALLSAAGIYRIRLASVHEDVDSDDFIWSRAEQMLCMSAVPLDTLKGRNFYSDCGTNTTPCLQFVVYPYAPCYNVHQFFPYMDHKTKRYYDNRNNAIIRNYTDFSWLPGNEYIIFLDAPMQPDTAYDYMRFKPLQGDPQGGVYPIINGKVQDYTNYFGMGESVSVTDFEKKIRDAISAIIQ
jgi:hypothetical protein